MADSIAHPQPQDHTAPEPHGAPTPHPSTVATHRRAEQHRYYTYRPRPEARM